MTHFGWVIERYVNSVLLYWSGRGPDNFLPKHDDAILFAREQDAAVVLSRICGGYGRVTQHGFMEEER